MWSIQNNAVDDEHDDLDVENFNIFDGIPQKDQVRFPTDPHIHCYCLAFNGSFNGNG